MRFTGEPKDQAAIDPLAGRIQLGQLTNHLTQLFNRLNVRVDGFCELLIIAHYLFEELGAESFGALEIVIERTLGYSACCDDIVECGAMLFLILQSVMDSLG